MKVPHLASIFLGRDRHVRVPAEPVKDLDFLKVMDKMFMSVLYLDGAQTQRFVEECDGKLGKVYEKMVAEEAAEKK